jgi:predicted nucleic acid-binding protein
MLLCDTGVQLAAGNVEHHAHDACLNLLRQAEGPLLVPSPVFGEIGYLLQSRVGARAEVAFLQSFGDDGFQVAEVTTADVTRMAEMVAEDIDLPLGIVDADVIAIAESARRRRGCFPGPPAFQRRQATSRAGPPAPA